MATRATKNGASGLWLSHSAAWLVLVKPNESVGLEHRIALTALIHGT